MENNKRHQTEANDITTDKQKEYIRINKKLDKLGGNEDSKEYWDAVGNAWKEHYRKACFAAINQLPVSVYVDEVEEALKEVFE